MNAMFKRELPNVLIFVVMASLMWQASNCRVVAQGGVENTTQYNWAQEQWSGNNRPYQTIRAAIDKAIAGRQKPYALAQKYEAAVQQKPLDPKALFRWAYATYQGYHANKKAREGLATLEDTRKLERVIQALARPRSSQPYDYMRLRFLMSADYFPHRAFIGLGRRLLRYNRTDTEVEHRQFRVLFRGPTDAQDRRDILAIAQDLRKRYPKEPDYYATLGAAYREIWRATKSPAHANMAIAAYRKYIQLAPPKARFRRIAQLNIDNIQKGM